MRSSLFIKQICKVMVICTWKCLFFFILFSGVWQAHWTNWQRMYKIIAIYCQGTTFYQLCTGTTKLTAGLSGSVGCAVRLETRRSRVQPPPRSATFFRGDWSWNIFYGHSLPSADSRRAVVSFWRKNVHNTGEPLRGLSLPSKRVVR